MFIPNVSPEKNYRNLHFFILTVLIISEIIIYRKLKLFLVKFKMQSSVEGNCVKVSCNLLHRHVLGWCKGFHEHITLLAFTNIILSGNSPHFPLRTFLITAETVGHAAMPFCRESGSMTFSWMCFRLNLYL